MTRVNICSGPIVVDGSQTPLRLGKILPERYDSGIPIVIQVLLKASPKQSARFMKKIKRLVFMFLAMIFLEVLLRQSVAMFLESIKQIVLEIV